MRENKAEKGLAKKKHAYTQKGIIDGDTCCCPFILGIRGLIAKTMGYVGLCGDQWEGRARR